MEIETFGGDVLLSPFVWVLRSAGVAGRHKHAVAYSMPEAARWANTWIFCDYSWL
jgi:hypothetical protein